MSGITRLDGGAELTLDQALDWFAGPVHAAFADTTIALGQEISRVLLADAALGRQADVVALAYFLRPAQTRRLIAHLRQGLAPACVAVPRGRCLVFTPGNVDTMFVYSWWLPLLAGNRVAVRLPGRRSALTESLLALLVEVLGQSDFATQAEASRFLSWPHDDGITARLSSACDVRIIWGGDRAVAAIRAYPTALAGIDISFPDRASLAAFDAGAYLALDQAGRDDLARRFAADLSAFDQMACSSPRVLAWCGAQGAAAAADFRPRLGGAMPPASPSVAMTKLVSAALAALDGDMARLHGFGSALLVAEGAAVAPEHCGGGLLSEWRLESLDDLAGRLSRRHQTLVHFGFDRASLARLVERLNGRALDRLVPVGKALDFTSVWDGQDLLRETIRLVWIEE